MINTLSVLAFLVLVFLPSIKPADPEQPALASMLQAKGITAAAPIRNILIQQDARGEHDTYLFSPREGWWIFHDFRPGVLGASVEVADFQQHRAWLAYIDKQGKTLPQDVPIDKFSGYRQRIAVTYLAQCEQSPLHAVFTAANGNDSLSADCGGSRFSFHLDRKTHLPSMIRDTFPRNAADGGKPDFTGENFDFDMKLTSYTSAGGLQVPGHATFGGMGFSSRVSVNVDTPPGLFSHPPGPNVQSADDWRQAR